MSYAIPVHVALCDDSGKTPMNELAAVAGALNEQVMSDFAPVWHVRATVGAYEADLVPPNTWALRLRDQLDEPDALGYHTDENHVPVSYIERASGWAQTASHELLEMLADPWGSRLHRARLPAGLEDRYGDVGLLSEHSYVHYLLEVCDPPEAEGYSVGGALLSDFLLPTWYRSNPTPSPAYSHAGNCTKPREVAPGGYVSFCNGNHWFQAFNWNGLQLQDIGIFDGSTATLRAWTDLKAREHRAALT